MAKNTKTLVITVPDRMIIAGEYMGNYGHAVTHIEALQNCLALRPTSASWLTYAEGVVELNIQFKTKIGKRQQEELDDAVRHGMVLSAEYI